MRQQQRGTESKLNSELPGGGKTQRDEGFCEKIKEYQISSGYMSVSAWR